VPTLLGYKSKSFTTLLPVLKKMASVGITTKSSSLMVSSNFYSTFTLSCTVDTYRCAIVLLQVFGLVPTSSKSFARPPFASLSLSLDLELPLVVRDLPVLSLSRPSPLSY